MIVYKATGFQHVIFEFLFWIVPQYLAIIYPNKIYTLILTIASLILFTGIKNIFLKVPKQKENVNYVPMLDAYRAYLMLMVLISIFACDFRIFPEKFYKTTFYGLSLMDIGIGSFLFNNGSMAIRYSRKKLLKTSIVMAALGFLRLFVISFFNYQVDITEYGKHLNFYFILSIVYLIFSVVNSNHNFKLGILLMIFHEYCLRVKSLDIFIFSEYRKSFLLQNKEGICNIIPSLSIFLFSSEFGKIGFSKASRYEKYIRMCIQSAVFIFFYYFCREFSTASRRLGNITYVSWIVALHSLHLVLALGIVAYVPFEPLKLQMIVSKNMLVMFLFSNILVLIGNLSFNLNSFSVFKAHVTNLVYLVVLFLLPYCLKVYLNRKKLQ